MPQMKSARIQDHFADLTDPRRRDVIYPLINVVVIAVCAVICGADDFVAMAEFGRMKREWLARFLDLRSGILRRTALSLLKNELTRKVGIKNKRLAAALDDTYLEKVLTGT